MNLLSSQREKKLIFLNIWYKLNLLVRVGFLLDGLWLWLTFIQKAACECHVCQ